MIGSRAHPRSRGENLKATTESRSIPGSSPLTRGKPGVADEGQTDDGLIPAHAGKTPLPVVRAGWRRAHPRSRGENHRRHRAAIEAGGSSPLTRGKHAPPGAWLSHDGLIPAHAGKTSHHDLSKVRTWAHPRSRGENCLRYGGQNHVPGSSPLTRGKPHLAPPGPRGPGLIPAHAGKTLPDLRFYRADRSDLGKP